ncbi:MAG: hypothetical protein QGI09_03800, partial [Dehalococcoidia bacterium]|nr:hypothetical protein [Dehalococcoidia bacterium]
AGIRGSALLGASGAGLIETLGDIARQCRISCERIEPRREMAEQYLSSMNEFKRIYDRLLGFW